VVATAERKTVGQQASCPPCLTPQDVDDPELGCRDHPSGGRGVADVEDRSADLDGAVPFAGLDHHRRQAGEAHFPHARDALLLAESLAAA
jgi:hypothetical protein